MRKQIHAIVNEAGGSWKDKLKRLLDDIIGVNEEISNVRNIAILLDCSASMGFHKFSDVSEYLTEEFEVRGLDTTRFHLVPWGSQSMNELSSKYVKVTGSKNVLSKLSTMKGDMGGTDATTVLAFMGEKVSKVDATFVLTDGEFLTWDYEDTASKFVKRNQKQLVWVVVQGRSTSKASITRLDKSAYSSGRVVEI